MCNYIFNSRKRKYLNANESYRLFDYDVVLIAGQSNAQGYGKGNEELKYVPQDPIYGYTEGFGFHLACDNMYNHNDFAASFALYFGQEYVDSGLLESNRKLLLLNTAVGGTGFSDRRWGKDDDLYNRMLTLSDRITAMNSKNRITAFIWHQGETDAMNHMSGSDYSQKLNYLITNTRKRLNIGKVPFVSGNMSEIWMKSNPNSYNIAAATRNLMSELPLCGYVESEGLAGNKTPDIIHFSRRSCVELGKRYFETYKMILQSI